MEKHLYGYDDTDEYLIIYDIADNKRRYRISRIMESYGIRVQESAFEFWLSRPKYLELLSKCKKVIQAEDSIRIYILNGKASCIFSTGISESMHYDVIIS
ncbi:MAG: CRISPR-associated endonuclease Cas2 [Clostridia bacterium]|nr:CRISPR-associated endonuclease Cas2 [Clostridia bacterium]